MLRCSEAEIGWNRSPPACALPTPAQIASSCAFGDAYASPGFIAPSEDQAGNLLKGSPLPVYKIEKLACRFSTPENNQAACTFDVEDTQTERRATGRTVTFEHRALRDEGQTHHAIWNIWSATDRCIPPDR